MVEIAAKRFNVDIFVVERPPRSDTVNYDNSMRKTLTMAANGLYICH